MKISTLFSSRKGKRPVEAAPRMTVRPAQNTPSNKRRTIAVALAGLLGACALFYTLIAMRAPLDFSILMTAMASLCAILGYESLHRRGWEREMTGKVHETIRNHDRLVREVARNRNDIAILKDGLAETAHMAENHAKSQGAANGGGDLKLIRIFTQKFAALGQKPRSTLASLQDNSILELEMAPPARGPEPQGRYDETLNSGRYSDTVISELVRHAVRQDQIELFVQPVMALPQRRLRMVECYARIRARAGTYLPATRYLKIAANDQLVASIDNLLLLQCLQLLSDRQSAVPSDVPFLVNIDATSLRDTGFMNDLVTFLARNRAMAGRLVFELSQAGFDSLNDRIVPILDGLSQLGIRFSMDSVTKKRFDIDQLKRLRVRFLKIDAEWLTREARRTGGAGRIQRLKQQLDAAGIDMVIEKLEQEDELRELLDFGIDYGQGYLLGRPDSYASWREKQGQRPARAA